MEIWKEIPGFEKYEASTEGNIRKKSNKRLLKPGKNQKGYFLANLYNSDGIKKTFCWHRAIALTFIPNPENLPQINHIIPDKSKNYVENLEWCDQKYNMKHAKENGLRPKPLRGEKNGRCKYLEKDIREIRRLKEIEGKTPKEIQEKFKHISLGYIYDILYYRNWKHVTVL